MNATLGAALDRVKLMAGSMDSPLLSVQVGRQRAIAERPYHRNGNQQACDGA